MLAEKGKRQFKRYNVGQVVLQKEKKKKADEPCGSPRSANESLGYEGSKTVGLVRFLKGIVPVAGSGCADLAVGKTVEVLVW